MYYRIWIITTSYEPLESFKSWQILNLLRNIFIYKRIELPLKTKCALSAWRFYTNKTIFDTQLEFLISTPSKFKLLVFHTYWKGDIKKSLLVAFKIRIKVWIRLEWIWAVIAQYWSPKFEKQRMGTSTLKFQILAGHLEFHSTQSHYYLCADTNWA